MRKKNGIWRIQLFCPENVSLKGRKINYSREHLDVMELGEERYLLEMKLSQDLYIHS